ncbi:MAG TPA: SPFH domain-containing protein [Burkholderiales bacterium]|nr:SPFH domain-containing protein [Burkholderiales bacterium]
MLQRFRDIGPVFIVVVLAFAAAGYALYRHPPIKAVARGEVGIRLNRLTGTVDEWRDANVVVVPGVHELRVFSLRDRVYRPVEAARADGPAPFQSVEGLSLGVEVAVRYTRDPTRLRALWNTLPEALGPDLVEPAVQSVMYKVFARYTVREIFSTKRPEIQQAIEAELKPKLAADGIALRDVLIGKVDLPADYRRGMEALLAEELASEKMRYTLELKEKRVKETELEAEAARVRREKAAEAAAQEQVISARAQDEAMKHVLPFKERQVEQRRLEAEAERVATIRRAKGHAEARRIEADGEAKARQRLADAEAYRLNQVGKANAEQMEREGALVSRHPLLVQKALVDKLSDKIQVIIAPPPADGGFIGATLLGGGRK